MRKDYIAASNEPICSAVKFVTDKPVKELKIIARLGNIVPRTEIRAKEVDLSCALAKGKISCIQENVKAIAKM
jgi:hypothetical protein